MTLWIKSLSVTKGKQVAVFPMVLFIILFKVVPAFGSVDTILTCDCSNKRYWVILSCGPICLSFWKGKISQICLIWLETNREQAKVNVPNFVYQGHIAKSAACNCRNKHGTYDESGFANLSGKKRKKEILSEVKNKRNCQIISPKSGSGRLREEVPYKRFQQ